MAAGALISNQVNRSLARKIMTSVMGAAVAINVEIFA
jgi:hypothetical protein